MAQIKLTAFRAMAVSTAAAMLFFMGTSATVLLTANQANALVATPLPETASGKLWMVPLDPSSPVVGLRTGANAVFPVPSATPDVTFSTNIVSFSSPGSCADPLVDGACIPAGPGSYTVGGFLFPPAFGFGFSGLVNPNVGGVVDSTTALYNETAAGFPGDHSWATEMEITGKLLLENGTHIKIAHDDGVSLVLNGVLTGCFTSPDGGQHFLAADEAESCIYNGPSGLIPFDLVYTEGFGGQALLEMAVPEPATLTILGLGLAGLGFMRRRRAA